MQAKIYLKTAASKETAVIFPVTVLPSMAIGRRYNETGRPLF